MSPQIIIIIIIKTPNPKSLSQWTQDRGRDREMNYLVMCNTIDFLLDPIPPPFLSLYLESACNEKGLNEQRLSRPSSTCSSPPSFCLIINSSLDSLLYFTFTFVRRGLWSCHMCYKTHLGCLWSCGAVRPATKFPVFTAFNYKIHNCASIKSW